MSIALVLSTATDPLTVTQRLSTVHHDDPKAVLEQSM
jgi:hypothetical protein